MEGCNSYHNGLCSVVIYLDHNATTPVFPEVHEAMRPYLESEWGNPSSSYRFGSKLKSIIESAREQVADFIGARLSSEVIFTSGGTESNNAAIHSGILSNPEKRHIVISQVEHSSVLSYCRFLEAHYGYRITYVPVDSDGILSMEDLEEATTNDTALVSIMWANNETGVLFPVEKVSALCRERKILFHCDAVQAAGKLPIDLRTLHCDFLSITGHKIGAPKGIGALYARRGTPFVPLLHGGHQEQSRRGGTQSVPGVVALGKAAEISQSKIADYSSTIQPIRDALEEGILAAIRGSMRNGHKEFRLSNTTNINFPGVESQALLLLLDQAGICASSGSACLADSPDPSHVIAAMKPGSSASQSVRFSLGFENVALDVMPIITSVATAVAGLKLL